MPVVPITKCRCQGGFSLVEVAVVLAVVAVLLGTVLSGSASLLQRARFSDARADLRQAMEAILGFTYAQGRLPCPDLDGDGLEAVADCNGAAGPVVGSLPAQDLGIPATDPWGQAYVYAVDPDFADDPGPNAVSFTLDSTADLVVQDGGGNNIAGGVAFVVFSRGPNRYTGTAGAGRPSENENNDGDNVFASAVYSDSGNNIYDDVIDWMSANVLKARMVEAGRLP